MTTIQELDGRKVYSSKLTSPQVPEIPVYDFILGNTSFDETHLAFHEISKRGNKISFGQLKLQAQQLGLGLIHKLGLQPNDTVLLVLPSGIHFAVALLASVFAGLRVSFANPNYLRSELRHVYNALKPKKIFTVGSMLKTISRGGLPWNQVVLMDTELGYSTVAAKKLMASPEEAKKAKAVAPKSLDDTLYLPWSSGTTGLPKAIEITHRNVVSMLSYLKIVPNLYPKTMSTLVCLPFFHALALIKSCHLSVWMKATVYVMPFAPNALCEVIKEYKIECMSSVPPILKALSECPKGDRDHLGSLKWISVGAAPMDSELEQIIQDKLGVPIIQGYGMSETTVAALGLQQGQRKGTVGWPVPGVECRVADDDNSDVPLGERGELLLRGRNITKGYYKNQEANDSTFSTDGWLKTGDVVIVDDRGEFTIVDRKKELIKYKGFQVAPAELEGLLLQHKEVFAAAVVGIYDKQQATELPRAYIQLRDPSKKGNAAAIEKEVAEYIKSRVSSFKQLRGGVKVLDAIPVSPSGKILRKEVRKIVEQEMAAKASKL